MEPVDSEVDGSALPDLDDLLLDLLLDLCHDLLDACWVDAAVGDELVECESCDFAAHGVESREDDRLGGIVDDDLDAGCGLQGPDVASFASDDAALYLVALDVEDRDGILDGCFGCDTLDRGYDDSFGLFRGGHLGLLDGFVDIGGGFGLGLGLHVLHEDVLGLLGAHSGDLFEADVLFASHLVDLLLLVLDELHLVLHLLLEPVVFPEPVFQVALLVLEVLFELFDALFALCEFLISFVDLSVVFAFQLDKLLLGLKDSLLLDHLGFGFGLLECSFASFADGILDHEVDNDGVNYDGNHRGDTCCQNGDIHCTLRVFNC